jgi:hypothetical protein
LSGAEIIRALFVPSVASKGSRANAPENAVLITATDLLELSGAGTVDD